MKYLFLICLCFNFILAIGQQAEYLNPKINGQTLPSFLDNYFSDSFQHRLDILGIHGTTWVKFKISVDGKLKRVVCSPGTHPTLIRFIIEAIMLTNEYWKPKIENGKAIESEWIVLPIDYTLQKNGRTKGEMVDSKELSEFFSDVNPVSPEKITFLKSLEFVSPFDNGNSWGPKLRIRN